MLALTLSRIISFTHTPRLIVTFKSNCSLKCNSCNCNPNPDCNSDFGSNRNCYTKQTEEKESVGGEMKRQRSSTYIGIIVVGSKCSNGNMKLGCPCFWQEPWSGVGE